MAARSVSPGGALLRASRVFSIPQPLPTPKGDLSAGAVFNSDTATLPHPTHLSITTPQAALKRGDWGFKRPLPLRSTTKTSTPFIRVKSIDTFEHVTEFGSSADHTLSLLKWHEMGVPLSTPIKQTSTSSFKLDDTRSGKSVFEDSIDTIAPVDGMVKGKDDARWKFSGPWLAGLTEGDFNEYVHKEVRRRKVDFRLFLRTACANQATQNQQRRATEEGEDIEALLPVKPSDITDEQLTDYIKTLRRDRTTLNKHIRSFLDLPPAPHFRIPEESWNDPNSPLSMVFAGEDADYQATSDSPYAESGPPKTHPSAGLSYSRTASHTFNHPLYGPQKYQPPVQARVVMPKKAAVGSFAPILGVGGFAVDIPVGESSFKNNPRHSKAAQSMSGIDAIDPDAVGGSKAWVHARHARIDSKGRVILNVTKADPESIAVKEGRVGDIPTEFIKPLPMRPSFISRNSGASSYGGGYGLGPRDFKGKAEGKRIEKADLDAVKELADFVDNHEKGNVE
ncbi:small ribosomal subunit bS1m [Hyphodiscus hymeniophilus]|uniref:Small ribosomal subunit bS1m n=1 Tax=Hyphodiscus hymeniophilus TaxID=353542 RepID=A0A9P6VRS9_9HELO|nr:small ribosomal subunit bS1m [Hyphodiscus hymeniophilus]